VGNYSFVAETGEIPSGKRKRVEINGQRITIFNIENTYYAINDTCPHKKTAPLIRGKLDGLGIKCPNHGYRFDLKTGECNIDSVFNTKIYAVKVEGNSILLKLG
jgi:nitrite reductase/ring-hydroxylating ferredoxin subunit